MTEEDTFNRLLRPTYSEMRQLWISSDLCKDAVRTGNLDDIASEAFFIKYKWTMEEYSYYRPKTHEKVYNYDE